MRWHLIIGALAVTQTCSSASAGSLDVPIYITAGDGQAADCASSTVSGLKSTGDGFLSVRSGPSEKYRELARLHNGEVVTVYETKGSWVGVVYRTENAECSARTTHQIKSPRKGWISSKYLTNLAG